MLIHNHSDGDDNNLFCATAVEVFRSSFIAVAICIAMLIAGYFVLSWTMESISSDPFYQENHYSYQSGNIGAILQSPGLYLRALAEGFGACLGSALLLGVTVLGLSKCDEYSTRLMAAWRFQNMHRELIHADSNGELFHLIVDGIPTKAMFRMRAESVANNLGENNSCIFEVPMDRSSAPAAAEWIFTECAKGSKLSYWD